MNLLEENMKDIDLIRIWSSHLNCDDYCLLLYLCSKIKNKKISVIFSEEFNYHCLSIDMMDGSEIPELLKREHILSEKEIEYYADEWKRLVNENSKLRYIVNGKVLSVPINYFDKEILNVLKKMGEVSLYHLIAMLMGHKIVNDANDLLYKYLIENLINNGKIVRTLKNGKEYVRVKE